MFDEMSEWGISGIRTGNGRAVRQTGRTDLCGKPSKQLVDKILRRSDSTDAEALGVPRKQQRHGILPNRRRIEDQRSVRADFRQQGQGAGGGRKSLKLGRRERRFSVAGRFLDLAFKSSFVFIDRYSLSFLCCFTITCCSKFLDRWRFLM